jgi:Saxitoxin biosynthesis operon protein SxtJ
MDTHLKKLEEDAVAGSERSFGLVFAAVFALIALLPLLKGGGVRWWSLALAAVFLALALLIPAVLKPLNVLWFKFGLLVGRVMTPLVMGILYILSVIPTGLFLRATGRDLLRLKREPAMKSYWIERESPGPAKGSMKRQF